MVKDISASIKYDANTGKLFWRKTMGSRALAGSEIRGTTFEGYVRVKVCGKLYMAHRIAWLLQHGKWPANEIDHIDGNKLNNKIENLRDVPKTLNQRNAKRRKDNSSGIVGVTRVRHRYDFWVAYWIDGKRKNKWFSVNKYGEEKAKELALSYRAQQIQKLGGYTERHGKERGTWLGS